MAEENLVTEHSTNVSHAAPNQDESTIEGNDLLHHITGERIPTRFDRSGRVTQEFAAWKRQDALLKSWLFASMTKPFTTRMVGCIYSYEIWKRLEDHFSSQIKAKIVQLKNKLSTIKIGSSVNEYVLAIKGTIDALASVGEPMRESDHVNAILNGLTEEYSTVITSVVGRPVSIAVGELETLLLTYESMLERFRKSDSFIQANVAEGGGYSQGYNTRGGFRNDYRGRGGRSARGTHGSSNNFIYDRGYYNGQGQFRSNNHNYRSDRSDNNYKSDAQFHDDVRFGNGSRFGNGYDPRFTNTEESRFVRERPVCQGTREVVLHEKVERVMYKFLNFTPSNKTAAFISAVSTPNPFLLWHNRLGHASNNIVSSVLKSCNIVAHSNNKNLCDSCCIGKSHAFPYPPSTTVYIAPLMLVYSDIWGPAPIPDLNGNFYFVNFVDAYSKFTWLYLIKTRSQLKSVFKYFQQMVKLQLNSKIKMFQSNNAAEYVSRAKDLQVQGIMHRFSCPHEHQQNGSAERKYRHVVEKALAILAGAGMPMQYWGEAFVMTIHLINRLPTLVLKDQSPFEKLFGKKCDYSRLKTFGCLCFPYLRPYNRHKLEFRSAACVFLGYSAVHKGYRCLTPQGKIIVSSNVVFDESQFPFKTGTFISSPNPEKAPSHIHLSPTIPLIKRCPTHLPQPSLSNTSNQLNQSQTPAAIQLQLSSHSSPTQAVSTTPSISNTSSHFASTFPAPSAPSDTAISVPISDLEIVSDNQPDLQILPLNTHPMIIRSKNGVFKPKALLAATEPRTVRAALSHQPRRLLWMQNMML
ncbi:uncharacterized protein [Arachis hypogaea]|uniref:uncharacterized protein n=1 Tax=Arachis hypogaea TaxID=3818 RepID=UPI003B2119BE